MEKTLAPLLTFKEQFGFEPTVLNDTSKEKYTSIIIAGMGGSAICVSLVKMLFPELPVLLHNTYGLPPITNKDSTLLIVNSYSGNTEEMLDTFDMALKNGIHVAALSRGGLLIHRCEEENVMHVFLPESNLEPRFSIGHQLIGLLSLMGEDDKIETLRNKASLIQVEKAEAEGKTLAEKLSGKYPILYCSKEYYPVAYLIKAAINEGAKIPSFVNQIPEANHNEIQSYVTDDTHNESAHFGFVILSSIYEHNRIEKRMNVMEELYGSKGFAVTRLFRDPTNITDIFDVILTGYFFATYLALQKNVDPYKTPFIQEFKLKIAQ